MPGNPRALMLGPDPDASVICEVDLKYFERARREALGEHAQPELPRGAHALPLEIRLPVIQKFSFVLFNPCRNRIQRQTLLRS